MTKIYLDSSFLVALLLDNHNSHSSAENSLLNVSKDKDYLVLISTLTIDEVWYTLYDLTGEKGRSFAEFTTGFSKTIDAFLTTYGVKIVDTLNGVKILNKALEGSEKFNLRPRDAFHYSNASLWQATIYTLDADYINTDLIVEHIQ